MAGSLPRNRGNRSSNRMGPVVSRKLRAAGLNPLPSARRHLTPGLFVSAAGDTAFVYIDYGTEATNREVCTALLAEVDGWGRVNRVDQDDTDYGAVRVTIQFESN